MFNLCNGGSSTCGGCVQSSNRYFKVENCAAAVTAAAGNDCKWWSFESGWWWTQGASGTDSGKTEISIFPLSSTPHCVNEAGSKSFKDECIATGVRRTV